MRLSELFLPEEDIPTTNRAGAWLISQGLDANNVKRNRARLSGVHHLRLQYPEDKVIKAFKDAGVTVTDQGTPNLSGKYNDLTAIFPNNFAEPELAGKRIHFVSTFKQQADGAQAKVAQKQLIPTKMGLEGKNFNKQSLTKALYQVIPTLSVDDELKEFLIQLVDVAVGKRPQVDPEVNSVIDADTRRIVGIDFGEILTPLLMSDGSDVILFPTGNAMLADVEINGQPISVKSGSGSGTSFRAINNIMDQFQSDVKAGKASLDDDEVNIHKFFRAFVDTQGNNKDKIIAGSHAAQTPEHQAMSKIIGKNDFTFDDLLEFAGKYDDYGEFLKAVYPASIAGNHGRPQGMPADYKYYMGQATNEPKKKQAGKPAWDARGDQAGADIMVYILGTSFLKDARQEQRSDQYNNLIKRMMNQVDAQLAHITVTPDGKLDLKQKSFSDMNYKFQYHAPSHIPGNNLPGFTLVVD